MRIGIIETGPVVDTLKSQFGDYPAMIRALLGAADPTLEFTTISLINGDLPGDPDDQDAWAITGSRHGVYNDLPWIAPLKVFLRDCLDRRVPVLGICFGHQILAEAAGGKVVKSDRGWGLGVHSYTTQNLPGWAAELGPGFDAHAVHQDQIISQPPGSTVLAISDFCPIAALAYGPPDTPHALSVQAHPEFDTDFTRALLEVRMPGVAPQERIDSAMATMGAPVANATLARIFVDFLHQAAKNRR